jgi:hypothetical protein
MREPFHGDLPFIRMGSGGWLLILQVLNHWILVSDPPNNVPGKFKEDCRPNNGTPLLLKALAIA